jgi:hypothetical protein
MKRQLICLMALACVASATPPATAAERIEFEPFGFGPPIYTRLEGTDEVGFHDGGWTCIPIYRGPEGIPKNFNLLEVIDTDTDRVRSVELLVDGFVITEGGPPKLQHYENRDDFDVPILFVRTDELQAIDDGDIVLDELLELTHMWGISDNYSEQVYTGLQHMIWASGFLEDGTPFIASYVHGAAAFIPGVEAHIFFGD